MVDDRIEVVSRKAGDDQACRWMSDDKSGLDIEPAEHSVAGTTILLHFNQEGRQFFRRLSPMYGWPSSSEMIQNFSFVSVIHSASSVICDSCYPPSQRLGSIRPENATIHTIARRDFQLR